MKTMPAIAPDLQLATSDFEDLARGASLLGAGGGGDPYIGRLYTEAAVERFGMPRVVPLSALADDARVACVAGFGAPTVQIEKLIRGEEVEHALRRLERHLGHRIDALLPAEIGGSNSMLPLMLGARLGLPVVDADTMGRAFPELQMNTLSIAGVRATPLAVVDENLDGAVVETADDATAERLTRALAIELGLRVFIAGFASTGAVVRRVAVGGTVSAALGVGRAIADGRRSGDPVAAALDFLATTEHYRVARELFDGRIGDLDRSTSRGFTVGACRLDSIGGGTSTAEVRFQNENMIALVDGRVRALVPDLICIVDRETGEPLPTHALRYGQRVKVLGISAPAHLRSAAALARCGPGAFGLDHAYSPLEALLGAAD